MLQPMRHYKHVDHSGFRNVDDTRVEPDRRSFLYLYVKIFEKVKETIKIAHHQRRKNTYVDGKQKCRTRIFKSISRNRQTGEHATTDEPGLNHEVDNLEADLTVGTTINLVSVTDNIYFMGLDLEVGMGGRLGNDERHAQHHDDKLQE